MSKQNIYGITPRQLEQYFTDIGENAAKARIVFDGLYRRAYDSFSLLPLSERVKARLTQDFDISLPEISAKTEGDDSAKLLLRLDDGEHIETVLMRQSFGACVCVSTQVGCNMGCRFCQSGKMKRVRDLTAAEIVGQIMAVQKSFGVKVTGVSVMGIGEPFDNYSAVMDFCAIATAPVGLEIGKRHITVSTCGIVPKMYDYTDSEFACNLAISLHAPNDALRCTLMPVNKAYPLAELITAAEHFSQRTNSRVTLEYVMLKEVNDTPVHALQLAELIGERRFYVNIIPYNPTECDDFSRTEFEDIMRFYDVLKKHGILVTMRREFGAGMKAACGQLRSDYLAE